MLIHFSKALLGVLANEIDRTEAVVQALQNIAQARSQGDHIITADPGVLPPLLINTSLSLNTRGIFKKIDSEQSQFGSLKNKLVTYVEIVEIRGDTMVVHRGDTTIIQIPLIRFQRNDIVQPTFLIAENLLDCQLLLTIASWFSKRYSNGILPSKLNAVFCPGGGDTTEKLLDHHSRCNRYFTLCITDSDQKIPNGRLGETTKKCRKLKLENFSQHFTLPTRSIENLLCHSQINAVLSVDKERKLLLPRLAKLSTLFGREPWKHLHVKNGVRDIHGPLQQTSETHYWRAVAAELGQHTSDNEGYLFPPISSNLLLWVTEHLNENDPEDIHSDQQLFEIWEKIALLVASWTCASVPIRI